MHVLVAGATGFLGRPLCGELLRRGHSVTALTRDPSRSSKSLPDRIELVGWDGPEMAAAVASSDALINLAGEPIAGKRWSPEYKAILRSSRIETTRKIVGSIPISGKNGQILVNASAVGYYGDQGNREVTEDTPAGKGFLPDLCVAWEAEALRAEQFGVRVVLPRIGIVLAEEGGALEKLITPFKMGVGGALGSGDQWLPWIHRADVIRMVIWLMESSAASGPFNVTSPEPVTMRGFAKALGKALKRPAILPVPGFALRLLVGEMVESLLTGQKALPRKAEKLGFKWTYPTLESALRNLV